MAAIYQWYLNEEIVFTTPLYPIEVIEGLNWMADITLVDTLGVAVEPAIATLEAVSGELETVLIYGNADTDATEATLEAVSGELETVLIYANADTDSTEASLVATEGWLWAARVEHIQPNEDQVHWDADITNVTRP